MRGLLFGLCVILVPSALHAQPSNFDFLRRMDANGNGRLESSEISSRARPFLERIASEGGIRLSSSVSISELESAARRSFERRARESRDGGGDGRSSSSSSSTRSFSSSSAAPSMGPVPGFGPDEDTLLVPGFGPDGTIRYPFTGPDEERARESVQRYDENKDGGIDRAEAARGRWSDNPFVYDFNDDGLLSVIEMAQRYARRRIQEEQEERSRARSGESEERSRDDRRSDEDRSRGYDRGREGSSDFRGERPDRTTYELAYAIVSRYDRNRNGELDRVEWVPVGDNIAQADTDRNGQISRGELAIWLSQDIQRKFRDFPADLPTWFFELDRNGDRQVSMAEFTNDWSSDKLSEFAGFDRNGDGFLTEKELLGSKAAVGGSYSNEKAYVIMPVGTITSDIVVDEDYLISDLDVQLSITHSNAEQLNAYLTGPDGQRIELFTGVGRSDDNFDGTILDDEAGERITRSRPPFRGRFLPEAAEKNEPSLKHFYGQSIKGTWQLEIRTSSGDRPGMLHGWSLLVRRPEELDSDARPEQGAEEGSSASADPRRDDQRSDEGQREGPPPAMGPGGPRDGERPRWFGERGGPPGFDYERFRRERYEGGGRPEYRGGPPGRGDGRGD